MGFIYLLLEVHLHIQQNIGWRSQKPSKNITKIQKKIIIKVAALHLRGKVHAWWKLEPISFENVKVSSYVNFTKSLVK